MLVGDEGFEPPASRSQSARSSQAELIPDDVAGDDHPADASRWVWFLCPRIRLFVAEGLGFEPRWPGGRTP